MIIAEYLQSLELNTQEITEVLEQCSAKELIQSEKSGWNILGIAEHILLTEKIVLKLLFTPSEKKSENTEIFGAEKLHKLIVKLRGRKVNAPDNLHPKGEIKSVEEFKTEIIKLRGLLKNGLSSGKIVIDNSVYPHPYLGEMTIRDWLNFIPAHTKRHFEQITERVEKIRKESLS